MFFTKNISIGVRNHFFAFIINAKKESTQEVVDVAKFIAQKVIK